MRKYMKLRIGMIASIVKDTRVDGVWMLVNFFCKGKLEKLFSSFLDSTNIKWARQ